MSKFTKGLGIAALALVVSAGGALAHGGHGGGWRGGVADCGAGAAAADAGATSRVMPLSTIENTDPK
jgi:hypothetical protein